MVPIKILLVDDEVMIKRVIIEKIDWAKYDMEIVKAVNSAQEALDYLEKFDVDLVITDIKMPLMDGNDFIEKANLTRRNLKFLVLSAYTDFEIVRKSFKLGVFDYMQKSDINTPIMHSLLSKLRNEINKAKKKSIIAKINLDANEASESLSAPEFPDSKEYSAIYVKLSCNKDIFKNISEAVKENKFGKENLFLLELNEESITMLIEHDFAPYDRKKNETAYVIKRVKEQLDEKGLYDFCIGVSEIGLGSKIDNLKYEAEKATEGEYYSDGLSKIFYYSQKRGGDGKKDSKLTVEYWKDKLTEHIKTLDIAGANSVFEELSKFVQSVNLVKNKCQELFFNVYLYYVNFLNSNNILNGDVEQDYAKIYSIIKQFGKFKQLDNWIKNNLINIQKSYSEKYENNITQILKTYIKQNLDKDLSLSCIAEQYGFNQSYISHLFKEKEGIPLRRYINNIRIDKAKYYLINTTIKIKDICSLLGYSNPEHFSREFKKKQGQSPINFRNQRTV